MIEDFEGNEHKVPQTILTIKFQEITYRAIYPESTEFFKTNDKIILQKVISDPSSNSYALQIRIGDITMPVGYINI